ncbi:hypothetical protein K474DRAFT_651483 [Panus rudis PR-1116 ss-1]|nr:hypothetical protein K474DRAFT_651483 [Panus rudis PR-1116 ss-1]
MGYITARWARTHFPCNSHHSYLDTMSSSSHSLGRKRSRSDSVSENDYVDEAGDAVPSLPHSPPTPKRPRQRPDPRVASEADVHTHDPVTPKRPTKSHPEGGPKPTPMKSDVQSQLVASTQAYANTQVKSYIKRELKGHIMRDYPVVDFVRQVWGFDPSMIPRGKTGYNITLALLLAYRDSTYYKDNDQPRIYKPGERNSCIAFEKICRHLIELLEKNWREQHGRDVGSQPPTQHDGILCFLREITISGDYAKFKPDFGLILKVLLKRRMVDWSQLGVCGELKKTRKNFLQGISQDLIIDPNLLNKRMRSSVNSGPSGRDDSFASFPSQADDAMTHDAEPVNKKRKIGHKSVRGDNGKDAEQSSPADSAANSSSPPLGDSHARHDESENLTEYEVQILKYLNEILSHGFRHHSSGFLVDNQWISLWYADRYGAVKSRSFDWTMEPHYLLLMIAALHFAPPVKLGFSPFIAQSPAVSGLASTADAALVLPKASPLEGAEITTPLTFPLDITPSRRIFTAYGIVGRGTTVIPIKMAGNAVAAGIPQRSPDELVAKVSWQHLSRKEATHIRNIRAALKQSQYAEARSCLDHVVDMKYSFALPMEDPQLALPRALMRYMPSLLVKDMRYFNVLILEAYEPLEHIATAEEFKKVFRDTVRAHHWVWKEAGVLHRDISINNIMFRRTPDDSVAGVLCDWDLSDTKDSIGNPEDLTVPTKATIRVWMERKGRSKSSTQGTMSTLGAPLPKSEAVDADENEQEGDGPEARQRARYRTGTGPFMAVELMVSDTTPVHRYRFDLQSFYFLLCWFAAGHNPEKREIRRITSWLHKDLKTVGAQKMMFIQQEEVRVKIFENAHQNYYDLIYSWVESLTTNIIYPSITIWNDIRTQRARLAKAVVDGNTEMQGRIKKEISRKTVELEESVTFEKFMDALDE